MFNFFGSQPQGYENIAPGEFSEMMKNGAVVIDVRQPDELREGSIPGHKMISMKDPDFFQQLQGLEKGPAYLLYCKTGIRSAQTCKALADLGHEKVYNLSGGIVAWNRNSV
jgi:rhodanese-related sulfurtransferase